MPTKKGKAKPAKAKKASNKMRRDHPVGGAVGARGVGKTRGGRSNNSRRTTGPRRTKTGALPTARATPGTAIKPPPPLDRPAEERGDTKAGGGERVTIL